MKRIIILFFISLILISCSNKDTNQDVNYITSNNTSTSNSTKKNTEGAYAFVYDGVKIGVDYEAKEIIDRLGEPINYFEAPSLTSQGVDKTYYYDGFKITSYSENNIDYIANIVLVSNAVSTLEGISIGSDIMQVINAYGNDYTKQSIQYVYTKGNTELHFIVDEEQVISIKYMPAK